MQLKAFRVSYKVKGWEHLDCADDYMARDENDAIRITFEDFARIFPKGTIIKESVKVEPIPA